MWWPVWVHMGRVRGHASWDISLSSSVVYDVVRCTITAVWCATSAVVMALPTVSAIKGNAIDLASRHLCLATISTGVGVVTCQYSIGMFRQSTWTMATLWQMMTLKMVGDPTSPVNTPDAVLERQLLVRRLRSSWTRMDDHLHKWTCFGGCCQRCQMSRKCVPTESGRMPTDFGSSTTA